jgi:hypothetical protein
MIDPRHPPASMLTVPFIKAVQIRAARIACSASATRGQGAGVVVGGRQFLAQVPLARFAVSRQDIFQRRLNEATDGLFRAFPRSARSWGLARKVLNIFLRDALYTTYLSERFNLSGAEQCFEIPLDSITAGRLSQEAGRGELPRWHGVKNLTPQVSADYQAFAAAYGASHRVARVHLDTYWWGNREGHPKV